MADDRTRKIVIAGALSAISVVLAITPLGYIPWFAGLSLTIIHVPAIVGAVLEGPVVGLTVGLVFGLTSMIRAAVAPNTPADVWFTNPLLSVMPRLLIGPAAWLVWRSLRRWPAAGAFAAGLVGSLVNTLLVLGMIGILGHAPWPVLLPIATTNGPLEAVVAAAITLAVVGSWWALPIGRRQGADL